jgi:hypothetical protein
MEDHKELFYMKLLEYEENLRKHYDKEKFVLSGLRYEAILNCFDKEKGHKTEEGAKFKHWAKNNFRKTTIGEKDILIGLKSDCTVVTRDVVFNVVHKCHLRTEHSGWDKTWHEVKKSYAGIRFPLIGLYMFQTKTSVEAHSWKAHYFLRISY